jgi:hypothetical protein
MKSSKNKIGKNKNKIDKSKNNIDSQSEISKKIKKKT